ncbi:MAG: response regulator [Lentisphaeraceae bacterium]|nr:response regulator [Lentisphaeraceae bacterium]
MKILLVEDRTGQARLIHKIILKDDAHEVIICKDAFEAFAALRAISGIDVVFLDNDLPYEQGMDLLQKIRATEDLSCLKVVMSTADEEYDSFKTLGANDCIHKPFNKDELYRILNEYKN